MTIVGRLGTDPEISESSNGNQVIKYVVGSSYGPKENRQTSWFRVASFAPQDSGLRTLVMGLTKGYVLTPSKETKRKRTTIAEQQRKHAN